MKKTLSVLCINEPLVSIIVPVYNIAPYISECIKSIQNQSYSNIEIIVIDDGSTDGSGKICDELAASDSRIQVIHQKNLGVVSARSKGIGASRGKYLSFIDGDDWVELDMIENMVQDIGEADLISAKVWRETGYNRWIEHGDRFPEGLYLGEAELEIILKKMIYDSDTEYIQNLTPWSANKLFLSSLAKKIYNNVNPEISFAEDAVFLYKYILNCNSITISHKCFYHYRYREESAVHGTDKRRLINVNMVYLALEKDFRTHKLRDSLLFQLQRWVLAMTCRAVNYSMEFNQKVYIPEFIADLTGLEDKRIILYGAGTAGKDIYRQLKKFGYTIISWADKNYQSYQGMGMPVVSPDEMFSQEYDVLFIAVGEKALAESIKQELQVKGIDKDRILWRKPIRVF